MIADALLTTSTLVMPSLIVLMEKASTRVVGSCKRDIKLNERSMREQEFLRQKFRNPLVDLDLSGVKPI